jgi:RNA polymerase sigma factor (sigma-70 family)
LEASALHPPAGLARPRLHAPTALLRLRSDEQLVALFRDGNDEAFRVIYERYRARLFAYTRQMLPFSRQDAEDALQDVFVRAYRALRSSDRDLALRPWLYRVAHNRCVDELRRPTPPPAEVLDVVRPPEADPLAAAERHDELRRLVTDLGRLPDQQRSALLMREIDGLCYADVAAALDTSIPAVKSLLVRARMGLAQAGEARETACDDIRGQLALARDRGVRASGQARRHLRDCATCRAYKGELRSVERRLAVFAPVLGPMAFTAKLLGIGGAATTGGSAAGSSAAGAAASSAVAGSGAAGGALVTAAAGKVVAVVAVAAVAGGAAVDVQHRLAPPAPQTAPAPAPAVTSAPAPAAHAHAHHAQATPAGHTSTISFLPVRRHAGATRHAHRTAAATAPVHPPVTRTPEAAQSDPVLPGTVPPAVDPTDTTVTDPAAVDPAADTDTTTDPTATTAPDTPATDTTDPATGEPVAGAPSTSTSIPGTTPAGPETTSPLPGLPLPTHLR